MGNLALLHSRQLLNSLLLVVPSGVSAKVVALYGKGREFQRGIQIRVAILDAASALQIFHTGDTRGDATLHTLLLQA